MWVTWLLNLPQVKKSLKSNPTLFDLCRLERIRRGKKRIKTTLSFREIIFTLLRWYYNSLSAELYLLPLDRSVATLVPRSLVVVALRARGSRGIAVIIMNALIKPADLCAFQIVIARLARTLASEPPSLIRSISLFPTVFLFWPCV